MLVEGAYKSVNFGAFDKTFRRIDVYVSRRAKTMKEFVAMRKSSGSSGVDLPVTQRKDLSLSAILARVS